MLYFVRHGQTNDNVNHVLTGRLNTALNEIGVKQAIEAGEQSKDLNIDMAFCSPLDRAKRTCQEIVKHHNIEMTVTEELIERSYGIYEGKVETVVDREKSWNYFEDAYINVMETPRELFGRVYAFLDRIKEKYKDKDVLIVAHNGIGRAIYCYFNGIPSDGNLLSFSMPNAKIITYKFED